MNGYAKEEKAKKKRNKDTLRKRTFHEFEVYRLVLL
ncbi:hypothetical protein Asulf_01853 [Archaeoglobus sulfaticallidus PM70-1]|uniref:Uncharacterized protein n=1 Tax=Archaeoglobus sulfaticallidus PM70-1 TaxID=387631 RepID=N0BMG4_9EURY|nr:hypothetical protein Asulf_01595 [Archaeoglobus sulfaticallidus PM70-1]AGK61821.1 hypothetical protein Asulf_01853 [Archaeoglobus sulfaticallidus PM70-1]